MASFEAPFFKIHILSSPYPNLKVPLSIYWFNIVEICAPERTPLILFLIMVLVIVHPAMTYVSFYPLWSFENTPLPWLAGTEVSLYSGAQRSAVLRRVLNLKSPYLWVALVGYGNSSFSRRSHHLTLAGTVSISGDTRNSNSLRRNQNKCIYINIFLLCDCFNVHWKHFFAVRCGSCKPPAATEHWKHACFPEELIFNFCLILNNWILNLDS